METTLDKSGRIVIPKEVRDSLDLKPGEALEVEEFDNRVILKPVREASPLHVKEGLLIFSGIATGDIVDAVKIHRSERLKKLATRKPK
ncbi:MAG TPA: AbrB/MazE/SpoVT family DNA-binding domain-containing protein [Thermodesulfovibrionia bacterium]|nr:AbrB/MazE/SpoVT family DNA-binding domain-containing protein [Thermodesulfovibrionia bacterium]